MNNYAVRLEDVCFAYESEMILKHIDAGIEANRITFVMGNNGSGKTTLLKSILGFLNPQSGRILINGASVSSIEKRSLSKLISYVPQAIHLNTDFSVIDYLALGRTPHVGLLAELNEEDYRIIEKYVVRLGIEKILGTPFNKLSGGQKQIVAIARNLIQDTPLIVLDEPMSALDIGKQVDLLVVFQELLQEGKTVILTTHNPNHALTTESNAWFLSSGELVYYGRSKEIISEELLQKTYGDNIALDHGEKQDFVVFNPDKIKPTLD